MSRESSSASDPVTVTSLRQMQQRGEKIAMLTAYDASFAAQLETAGIDTILVGDSLGNVIQGHKTTLPVTMDDMVYHTAAVSRCCQRALLIADMPFMSYSSIDLALTNAARLMQQGGAQMVKLECTAAQTEIVSALVDEGVPVCAHLGLRPQSVHKLGGYRVQGKEQAAAAAMLQQAQNLAAVGADLLLLEAVPTALAAQITQAVDVPVIGIGAGPDCDGQVLVVYDVLGISSGKTPRFAKNFLADLEPEQIARHGNSIQAALTAYVNAVKAVKFPAEKHSFS